jgi:peroxiredoxin
MKWRGLEESTAAAPSGNTLAQILQQRRELAERYTPSEVVALYQRAIDEIRASGVLERALKPGDRVPEFVLADENEIQVTSQALLTKGPLIVCFFRGRWCPFDIAQLEATSELLPQVQAAGVSLVAISPQTPHQASLMHHQHKLKFPLLCDKGNQVARQFGLVYRVPDYQQQVYRRSFVNLPFANGDDSWELPLAATYVVRGDRTIRYARVDVDYRQRPEPLDVLKVAGS